MATDKSPDYDPWKRRIQNKTPESVSAKQDLPAKAATQELVAGLHQSEELFFRAFRSSPAALVISVLEDGRILDANDSFLKVFGYEREEVLGRTSLELNMWKDPQERKELTDRLQKYGSVSGFEIGMRTKLGALRNGILSTEMIELAGRPCMLTTLSDITDSKRAKAELAESEERFRALSEASFEGIVIHENGTILEVNDSFSKLFGYERQELIGKSSYLFIAPESHRLVRHNIERDYEKPYEVKAVKRDGSLVHLEVVGRRCRFQGKSVQVVAVRNITERKRAEETIQSLVSLGRRLSSSLNVNVLADELAEEAIRIIGADGGFVGICELGGLKCRKYFHDSGIEALAYCFTRSHGLPGWVLIHKIPYLTNDAENDKHVVLPGLQANDGIASALCVPILDVQRKVAGCIEVHRKKGRPGFSEAEEETLIAVSQAASIAIQNALDYRKVQQAEDTLREFSKSIILSQEEERRRVARDLHDSVNQILSSAKFSLLSLDEKVTQNESVEKEVKRARLLLDQAIHEIRTISRNLRQTVLDDLGLLPAVRTLCDEFQERSHMKVDLESFDLPEVLPSEVQVTLYRVVQEALTNVEKHSDATRVEMCLSGADGQIVASIKDNGKGFDPLPALARPRKAGLGLRNMKERVALLGGTVDVHSAPGAGTEVVIRVSCSA